MEIIASAALYEIKGGSFRFSAAFINATSRAIGILLDIGRSVGTSIRMVVSGRRC